MLRGEEIVMLVLALVAVGTVAGWLKRSQDLGRERLRVVEKALQHPDLDAVTRSELLRLLARGVNERWDERLARYVPLLRTLWLGASWVVFVGSIAFAGLFAATNAPEYAWRVGGGFAVVGFLGLTLPTAIREFTRHDRVSSPRNP